MKPIDRLSEGDRPNEELPELPPEPAPVLKRRRPRQVVPQNGSTRAVVSRSRAPSIPDPIRATLREVDRDELERLAMDPGMSAKALFEWLQERGYPYRAVDVKKYLKDFRKSLQGVHRSAQFAHEFQRLIHCARDSIHQSDIVVSRFEQALMEQMFRFDHDGKVAELPTQELKELGKLVEQAVSARKTMETVRREFEEARREAVRESQAAARSGATGADVADRVREMLGIPLDNELSPLEPPGFDG